MLCIPQKRSNFNVRLHSVCTSKKKNTAGSERIIILCLRMHLNGFIFCVYCLKLINKCEFLHCVFVPVQGNVVCQ